MKYYVVEVFNDLTVEREFFKVDANSVQEAVDFVRSERLGDDLANYYTVADVFVEVEEAWE